MIYTSYYSNPKLRSKTRLIVGVSIGEPKTQYSILDTSLAPTWAMVRRDYTKEEYFELLEKRNINAKHVIEKYDNNVLCCFEKDENTCHRRWLAEWLEQKTGIVIKELCGEMV